MLRVCGCRYLCCGCVGAGAYVRVCGCRSLCWSVGVGDYIVGVWV